MLLDLMWYIMYSKVKYELLDIISDKAMRRKSSPRGGGGGGGGGGWRGRSVTSQVDSQRASRVRCSMHDGMSGEA